MTTEWSWPIMPPSCRDRPVRDSRVPPGRRGESATPSMRGPGSAARSRRAVPTDAPQMTVPELGSLTWVPATERPDLLGAPVAAALSLLPGPAWVAEIDAELADTAAFCAAYDVPLESSANCVVVAARRAGQTTLAACLVLATTRADVNGLVRRHLGARKASLAPHDGAVAAAGMEFGGITPVGVPADWPLIIVPGVEDADFVVIGS